MQWKRRKREEVTAMEEITASDLTRASFGDVAS